MVKVLINNKQRKIKIPTGIRMLIRRCCNAVLHYEQISHKAEVSVTFIDNDEIAALNQQYRQKDTPTDVLSFPLGQNGEYDINNTTGAYMLGDIVISAEKAFEQAELYGHTVQREIGFLTVHSMLHLLGYDHENGGMDALNMREREEVVLGRLGISRDKTLVG